MRVFWGVLLLLLVGCQSDSDVVIPTEFDREQVATERAELATATHQRQLTLTTATRTPTITLTNTATATSTPTNTPSPTATVSSTPSPLPPTITSAPSDTPLPITPSTPTQTFTPSITPSETFTPTIALTPTRVSNPDAVVGSFPAALRIAPQDDAQSIADIAPNTAIFIDQRTPQDEWFQVRFALGSGWVSAEDVIVLIDLGQVPIYSSGQPEPPVVETLAPNQNPVNPSNPSIHADLNPLPTVDPEDDGDGVPYQDYDFAVCGDTYWTGDGVQFSMEDVAYEGRYPRFSQLPIRVYVYGLIDLEDRDLREAWELAISQVFAELSQAVPLERVVADDLVFFEPWVPLETLLADRRVDMVWHIVPAEVYGANAPCDDPFACSVYGFDGAVLGGPLQFGSMVYIPNNVPDKKKILLHNAIHALGVVAHSGNPLDVMSPIRQAGSMTARDINTLRCLYNAFPYGDAITD